MGNAELSVCFLARPALDRLTPILYKMIKKRHEQNVFGAFIASNNKEADILASALHGYRGSTVIYNAASYFRRHWNEFTYAKFCAYEKKYGCEPLWDIIYTDRFLILRDHDYCIRVTAGYFQFFEEIFQKNRYDFYYDECISTLQSYIAYIVGKHMGVQYISQVVARGGIDGQYHFMMTECMEYISGFQNQYMQVPYCDEEMKKANAFLTAFEQKDQIPAYQKMFLKAPEFHAKYILAPVRYLKYRMDPNLNDPYFYMYYQSYKHALDQERFYFRYRKSRKYYHKADLSRKYVYFPLHYQPESSTLVRAQKYEKQLYFIDSWAKSLPADTLLYVKEHYTLLGNREIRFYQELQKYPNVVMIDPWEKSRELIKNAAAVTTLTGSAGFEAMLLRKPVIISGNVFFEYAPGVIKVQDIYQQYLPAMESWKKPEREEILKFLCEYFRCLYEGNANFWTEECYEKENLMKLSDALYTHMMKMKAARLKCE